MVFGKIVSDANAVHQREWMAAKELVLFGKVVNNANAMHQQ